MINATNDIQQIIATKGGEKLIISSSYTPGAYIDMRCRPAYCSPCQCGWSCTPCNSCQPCNPCSPCTPCMPPCHQPFSCGCNGITIPSGAIYFMAGYLLRRTFE